MSSGNKSQLIFDFIKCIENNKYKLSIDKRISISNHSLPILNSLALSSIQYNEVDRKLLDLAKKTKIFIKEMNNSVIFTRTDKGNVTVTLNGKIYVSKIIEMLQNTKNTYEIIKREIPQRELLQVFGECL